MLFPLTLGEEAAGKVECLAILLDQTFCIVMYQCSCVISPQFTPDFFLDTQFNSYINNCIKLNKYDL